MFIEDRSPYFADFGVIARYGDQQAVVILDAPEHDVLGGRAQSTAYSMTYETGAFPTLGHGDQLTIEGVNYTVQTVNGTSDGAISLAVLQRS